MQFCFWFRSENFMNNIDKALPVRTECFERIQKPAEIELDDESSLLPCDLAIRYDRSKNLSGLDLFDVIPRIGKGTTLRWAFLKA